MIRIKPKKDYLIALESVAMTDIVMNMFIFFFISFSLIYTINPARISKIEVNLPKASSAVALEGSEKIVLAITDKGEYFMNEDSVEGPDLKDILKKRLSDNPDMSLILKVDGAAKFDKVAKALDIIHELNIPRVSVAAVRGE
jgi:biopolymer transport protein ExbD